MPTNIIEVKKSANIGEVGVKGEEVKYRGKMPTSFMDGPLQGRQMYGCIKLSVTVTAIQQINSM